MDEKELLALVRGTHSNVESSIARGDAAVVNTPTEQVAATYYLQAIADAAAVGLRVLLTALELEE